MMESRDDNSGELNLVEFKSEQCRDAINNKLVIYALLSEYKLPSENPS